ncbi:MAG: iron ABC transporter permease [Negativicutes bacterium]|nr:iron ABC transporter permease [Negativicutes bacterium]
MKTQSKVSHLNRIILILSLLLLLLISVSFLLGRYPVPLPELLGILASRIFPIAPFWTERMESIVFNVRLPRILAACLVGCSLSAAGAAYQGVFQNPMASPDILGATAGAAFGAALAILLGAGSRLIMLSAFCFSLLTVVLVWLISLRARGSRVLSLILAGIMVSSLFSAGTSFLKLVADPTDQLPAITYWLMGSLAGIKADDLLFVTIPMLVGLLILLLLRWRINILTLGDEQARTMGIDAKRLRLLVILASTLITAAAVSVSGMIGWVGLVIPHLSRRLVGSNYQALMPVAMLFGALFLLLVDNVSRNLLAVEIPIGILTALIGAPFFLFLITKKGEQL